MQTLEQAYLAAMKHTDACYNADKYSVSAWYDAVNAEMDALIAWQSEINGRNNSLDESNILL